jgi:transposase-like protein
MAKKYQQTQPGDDLDVLSEVQNRAVELLASGVSYRSVCDRLGIDPSTLSRWQKLPTFRAAINKILHESRDAVSRRMVHASGVALQTLIEICLKTEASDRDRIAAANSILNLVAPQPMNPGPTDAAEIEKRDQEESLWADLQTMI